MVKLSERFPIVVQIVGLHLMVISPDFQEWIGERYNPKIIGQTELLIGRLRGRLDHLIQIRKKNGEHIPSPAVFSVKAAEIDPAILTVSQAARLMNVSRFTLWRMANEGKIAYRETPGGHRRFKRAEIERILG